MEKKVKELFPTPGAVWNTNPAPRAGVLALMEDCAPGALSG